MATNSKTKYKICTNCGKEKHFKDKYYSCKNPLYADGKFPVCKDCLKEKINVEDMSTVLHFLKSNDIYFDSERWNIIIAKRGKKFSTFGVYLKDVGTLSQYNNLGWKDSKLGEYDTKKKNEKDENIKQQQEVVYEETEDKEPFKVTKEMIYRWGRGYTPEQYEYVEYCYQQWNDKKGRGMYDLSQDTYFQMLAMKQLEIRIAREKNQPTKHLDEALLKIMADADLALKNKKDKTSENDRYSKWLEDLEKYRPADYFKDKKLFKDFDKIWDYFKRFILRPLKNLLTGSKDFDNEYTIENIDNLGIDDLEEEKPKKKRRVNKKKTGDENE